LPLRRCAPAITDSVAGWLAGNYAAAAHKKLASAKGDARWQILRPFVQDWFLLRRGDQSAARLQLERETLDWFRTQNDAEMEKRFWKWVKRPEIRKKLYPNRNRGLSKTKLREIERKLNLM
jgi:hypothetical protein